MVLNIDNPLTSIGSPVAGGTTGSVLFIGATGQIQQDNANFFWDDSNNRLGIGTTTPTAPLDINTGGAAYIQLTSTTRFTEVGVASANTQFGANVTTGDSIIKFSQTLLFLKGSNGAEWARINTIGQMSIGGAAPNANAILDLQSTTYAFMPPRMTTTQKNAIASPTSGMVVFDTTLGKLSVYGAASWETVTSV